MFDADIVSGARERVVVVIGGGWGGGVLIRLCRQGKGQHRTFVELVALLYGNFLR